jgi:hypothetical protein
MPDKKMVVIPAGSLLTISTGEYSDYNVAGVFRALADIDANALQDEWKEQHPGEGDKFDDDAFLAWIAGRKLLEPVPSFEWHLTDYYSFSEMWIMDGRE